MLAPHRVSLPLALVMLALTAASASAYTAEFVTFSNGVTGVRTTGTAANDTITMRDLGNNSVEFVGSDNATVVGGCTATQRTAICPVADTTTNVTLRGGDGGDTLTALSAPRSLALEGQGGDDKLKVAQAPPGAGSTFATALRGGAGDDVLDGSPGADSLDGDVGDDVLAGREGNDRLIHGPGGDVIAGGGGIDEGSYLVNFNTPRTTGIAVQAGDGVCTDGSAEDNAEGTRPALPAGVSSTCAPGGNGVQRDDFQGDLEVITATNGIDTIVGSSANETINGLGDNDTLEGAVGNDTLIGDNATSSANDTLLSRDLALDNGSVCGGGTDRAVADPEDPVDPDCETVERGGNGVTGPGGGVVPPTVGGNPPAGSTGGVPAEGQPLSPATPLATPPFAPAGARNGGTEGGNGKGGGDDGKTPPQLKIFGQVLAIDSRGRAQARITCVYKAKECAGSARLTAGRTIKSGKRQIKRGTVVGSARIKIPWGRTAKVPIRVSPAFRAVLGKQRGKATTLKLAVEARDSGAGSRAKAARASRSLRTALAG